MLFSGADGPVRSAIRNSQFVSVPVRGTPFVLRIAYCVLRDAEVSR
jgi:hypothetical protein